MVNLKKSKFYAIIRENLLLFNILISILVGFIIGIILKKSDWNNTRNVLWFTLPGTLFIRALEMLIVPVIFVGVVSATSSLSPKNNIKMTFISLGLILLTHFLAVLSALLGSFVVKRIGARSTIELCKNETNVLLSNKKNQKTTYDIISDILRNLLPKNIIKATTHQELTRYVPSKDDEFEFVPKVEYIEGTNLLGLLVFAVLLGLASSLLEEKAEYFRNLFKSTNEVVTLVLKWLILLAPIGIGCLIIDAVLGVEDLGESLKNIGVFTGICSLTLFVYVTLVLGTLIFVFTRKNPLTLYFVFVEPMLLSFASTSGAVCISKSIEMCDRIKIDKRISKFSIPFYTALQSDGSAIFIVMACTFLAEYAGVTLSVADYAVICIMTIILCLCLPSVPSSSIVTILVILNGINLSYLNIGILYTVEWLLDRLRTSVNLYSHCFCTFITNELCKDGIVEEKSPEINSNKHIFQDNDQEDSAFHKSTEM